MNQYTPDASSNRSESPDAARYAPNTGLYQFPGPQPAYIPGFYYSLPNATPDATLQNAPANAFTGAANTYINQGPVFAMGFAPPVVSQAPGEKRIEVVEGPHAKRAKAGSSAMQDDPLFQPMLDANGKPTGRFKCIKDGMVLYPDSYRKHIKTKKHEGTKSERYKCPVCPKRFGRRDACKRHYDLSECGRSTAWLLQPLSLAGPAAASSSLVPPVVVPTMAFTYHHPYVMSVPQHTQTAPPPAGAPQSWGIPTFAAPGPAHFQTANDMVPEHV
ncbi:hypothetical protein CY34DRAFT_14332 [Suillus luteus UH-Slu-Lm8-n1]|uniref:C2H2-type domain-containing protein n=1 Tax=Suillus luteus UH-Slu-Lm8-n1 TaxID=930992 RepID=A0A0D0ACY1_9AGAM|nr:hypothetical protein CY34DRAFT_14332 [Suillus luteus UH-Slu-Lm8-n1]